MGSLQRRAFLSLMGGACGTLAAPALAHGAVETAGTAFGTYWRALTAGRPAEVRAQALAVFEAVDAAMSPWRRDSELARFNALREIKPFAVSPALAHVTAAALDIAAQSGGAFDPTVGPLVARYGFGPIVGEAGPGWRALRIDAGHLTKARPGVTLDLCGIAKGHAIDVLAARLDAAGFGDWMIDLGGELRARGRHPSGRSWRTAVVRPFARDGHALAALRLSDEAVATSGPGEQSYRVGDRRIGHMIDPATGEPAATGVLSVTVVAATALRADALATALAAMEPRRGADWARARGIAAMIVAEDAAGAERVDMIGDIAKRRIDWGTG